MLRQRLRPLPYPHPAFFSSACFLSSSYFFNRPYGNQMGTKFWEVVCDEYGIGGNGECCGDNTLRPHRRIYSEALGENTCLVRCSSTSSPA